MNRQENQMSRYKAEGFVTDKGYVRIEDMTRDQLIECINHLSFEMNTARECWAGSAKMHRVFAQAREGRAY